MRKKKGIFIPAVGAGSLLTAFAVLCLSVFAMLGLSAIQAESRLAAASAQAVSDYYTADFQAEQIFARLRMGELPEEVQQKGTLYTYQCPISEEQYLLVILEKRDFSWQVLCWQAVAREDTGETDPLPVWQGESEQEETHD